MTVLSSDALLAGALRLADDCGARYGSDADAVDGTPPRLVAEPTTVQAVPPLLAWASGEGLTVGVAGGRTKLTWGAPIQPTDLLLSTTRLASVIEHRHGDLTATVEAGATLASVNATLAAHRQWLPWDPPWAERATIGGIVATNDSGPRRHGFGAPRDSIIGVTIARIDGETAKAGGIVVKNVAGYDLSRLLTGSFGCLGVILTATFKLSPVAPASRTVEVTFADGGLEAAGAVARDLAASPLTPTALELAAGGELAAPSVLVRFETVETAATQQADEATAIIGNRGATRIITDDEEATVWRRHGTLWVSESGTVVKLSVVPAELTATLARLSSRATELGLSVAMAGRAGLGVIDLRIDGSVDAQAPLITEVREQLPVGRGSLVIRQAEPTLRRRVDPWGPIGDARSVMQAVKSRFDPDARLNRGRGPGGL